MNVSHEAREAAVRRVAARRTFNTHLAIYLMVNALLMVIWAVQGAGEFFPLWTILGWGLGLVIHARKVHFRRPITEAEIRTEMERSN